jgi:hypothetical protein
MMAASDDDIAKEAPQEEIDRIVRSGPSGAFAVAGIAMAIVMAIYYAFYLFAYLPRGIVR